MGRPPSRPRTRDRWRISLLDKEEISTCRNDDALAAQPCLGLTVQLEFLGLITSLSHNSTTRCRKGANERIVDIQTLHRRIAGLGIVMILDEEVN